MARLVANVNILTETFETWLLKTNTLLDALSTEILTATPVSGGATPDWAFTGNTSVPRNGLLIGKFLSNGMYVTNELAGGQVSLNATSGFYELLLANLNITSNVSIAAVTVNSAANSRYTNTAFFEANVQANGAVVTIVPFSNTGSRATEFTVNTNTITVRSANVVVRSNTSFTAMTVVNDDTTSNTNMFGNNLNISANLVVSSLNHTIAGNTNFDSGSLFVDGTNNRVGIKTTTPDTELTVVGSANVVGNNWVGDRLTVVGNSSVTSGIFTVTTNPSSANVVSVVAANVNIDSGTFFVDQTTNRIGINTTTPDASLQVEGQANVSGAVRFANTSNTIGAAGFSNTVLIVGAATLSNTLTVAGNVQFNSTGLHTIAGNVNFDSGTLFVDSVNDRVGLGTAFPNARLSVSGDSNTSGAMWVGGNANITSGILTVNSAGSTNTVVITAANVNIDAGTLFVDQTTNRVGINSTAPDAALAVTGTANVSGATRLGSTLTVIGAANVISTFGVTGAANALSTFGVTGAANALSTFGVTGLTTLAGNVNTTVANASIAVNVGANVNLTTADITVGTSLSNTFISASIIDTDGRLAVLGNTNLSNTLTVVGSTTLQNTLNVVGAANLQSSANVGGTLGVAGATTLASTLSVTGSANVLSTFGMTGAANALSTFGITGAANALSTFGVTGLTTLSGNVNTTTANASVAINVGANVNLTTSRITVGTSTSNTFITAGTIETDGTLVVTGAANALSTLGVGGLATLSGNVNTTTANASVAVNVGANVNITTADITVGNASVNTFISSTVIDTDGRLAVLGNTNLSNTLSVTGATLLSNTLNVVGAANLQSSANVGGTLGVAGATTLGSSLSVAGQANVLSTFGITGAANALSTFGVSGAANLASTLGVAGLTTLSGNVNTTTANASVAVNVGANVAANTSQLRISNGANFSAITGTNITTTGTMNVTGDAGFTSNVTVGGTLQAASLSVTSSLVMEGDYAIDISSNGNIGSAGSPQKVYEFQRAAYRTGKIMVQVRNGANTQMSEMVIAHNDTDSYLTVYGTVSSPPTANAFASPLGTFTTTINSTSNAVELFLQQTVANSAVKVVAHLIK